jgi:hypothetical protein
MTDLFQRVWLRTDTYIDNLSPGQRRQLRALCEKFFEQGREMGTRRLPKKCTDVPEMGKEQEGGWE